MFWIDDIRGTDTSAVFVVITNGRQTKKHTFIGLLADTQTRGLGKEAHLKIKLMYNMYIFCWGLLFPGRRVRVLKTLANSLTQTHTPTHNNKTTYYYATRRTG